MQWSLRNLPGGLCLCALLLAAARADVPDLDLGSYRGKIVYLDFWASWCTPCRRSFPWLADVQSRYGSQNLVVVAVNLDQDRNKAERFLNDVPANFTVLYDPDGRIASAYKVKAMPSSFLIDRSGRVRFEHHGFSPKEISDYEGQIAALIEEKHQP